MAVACAFAAPESGLTKKPSPVSRLPFAAPDMICPRLVVLPNNPVTGFKSFIN